MKSFCLLPTRLPISGYLVAVFPLLLCIGCLRNTTPVTDLAPALPPGDSVAAPCQYENEMGSLGIGVVRMPAVFELFSDSSLRTPVLRADMYADESIAICPMFFKPDYGILQFVCLAIGSNHYRLAHRSGEVYAPRDTGYVFRTWNTYLTESFGVSRKNPRSPLRTDASDNAPALLLPDGHEMFCALSLDGDWLLVTYDCFHNQEANPHEGEPCHEFIGECTTPLNGWIRWREDGRLAVNVYLMP